MTITVLQLVTAPTKTVECSDFLHKSVFADSSEKVENVEVVDYGSVTIETLDSVKRGDLMELPNIINYMSVVTHVLTVFFEGIQKKTE